MIEETIVKWQERPRTVVVIGGAWGDEGKGKIASRMSKYADLVIRGTGGANAGHTVVFEGQKIALHLIPGGIVYPQTTCLIGQGVVIDPEVLLNEIELLEEKGIPNVKERLKISGRAHVVFPYHKILDEIYEEIKNNPIGTTKRGIGPAYADKDKRVGIRVYDLLRDFSEFEERVKEATVEYDFFLEMCNKRFYGGMKQDLKAYDAAMVQKYFEYGRKLKPMVVNGDHLVDEFVSNKKKIVLEGAQGYRLDKDFGDYPDVTASNCATEGSLLGGHLNHKDLKETIVVLKAYCSRVGNGPFPTEAKRYANLIRDFGHEYGTTTGRPRRVGWFDAVMVKSSKRALAPDYLCINHLDTIGKIGKQIGKVYMCIMYNYKDETIEYYPDDMEYTKEIPLPIYRAFSGWDIPSGIRRYEDLPANAKEYIEAIEFHTGIPVKYIGVGPDNEDLIVRDDV